ncbi:MAG: flagellar biosynthetic protein FliQ [Maioricimonas sp. JB049]
MSPAEVAEIGRDLLMTAMLLAMPAVAVSLSVGLLISIFQTVTSIQEQTMTFAPRILAVAVVMIATLPWMIRVATAFTFRMMHHFLQAAQ